MEQGAQNIDTPLSPAEIGPDGVPIAQQKKRKSGDDSDEGSVLAIEEALDVPGKKSKKIKALKVDQVSLPTAVLWLMW